MKFKYYTQAQIKVKEQVVVRKDMDVNEHKRLSNITLRHTLKKKEHYFYCCSTFVNNKTMVIIIPHIINNQFYWLKDNHLI